MKHNLTDFEPTLLRLARFFSSRKYIPLYTIDDYLQDFRIIFLNCDDKFDDKRGVLFSTYLVNSCKNYLISVKRKLEKEVKSQNTLNDFVYGEDSVEVIDTIPHTIDETKSDLVDYLFTLENGEITYDFIVNNEKLKDLAKKYNTSISAISRINKRNLATLKLYAEKKLVITAYINGGITNEHI